MMPATSWRSRRSYQATRFRRARAEVEKEAGKDTKTMFERKTMVMYSIYFKRGTRNTR